MSEAPCTLFWPRRADAEPAAGASDGSTQDGEVRQGTYAVGAVQMLGDAEPVQDGRTFGTAVESGGSPDVVGRDSGDAGDPFGRIVGQQVGEFVQSGGPVTEEARVGHAFVDEDVGEAVEEGDVRTGARTQVYVGMTCEAHGTGVGHDQGGACKCPLEEAGADDGVGFDGIGADDQEAVGGLDVVEGVGAAGPSEGGGESGGGRGVAEAGAVVDVVGADDGPQELLDEVVLLVGGTGGGDRGHRVGSAVEDGRAQAVGDPCHRLVPGRRS